jgi:hypothetical protein
MFPCNTDMTEPIDSRQCPHKMPEICNPEGGNLAKQNQSPGATVWKPGAATPDDRLHY